VCHIWAIVVQIMLHVSLIGYSHIWGLYICNPFRDCSWQWSRGRWKQSPWAYGHTSRWCTSRYVPPKKKSLGCWNRCTAQPCCLCLTQICGPVALSWGAKHKEVTWCWQVQHIIVHKAQHVLDSMYHTNMGDVIPNKMTPSRICQNTFSWWQFEGFSGFHNSAVHQW
jgi:hypothetical protein